MDIEEGEYIQRLEAFEMWIWRRVMKISWTEHRSNQELCDMVGENRGLINSIRQGQKNWMGHVLRGDSPSYSLGGYDGRNENAQRTEYYNAGLDEEQ